MESIKRFLAGCFVLTGLSAFAANPAYESFKGTNGQVVTTPGIGAARVVVISGQNFQPGSTNLTNWANLPTNALSFSQIWTNDAGTVYLVPTDVFEVFTTNLNNEGVLYSLGPLTLGSTSQILSLGTNDVDTSQQSDRVMTSPTNDAALVKLRFTPPTYGAQLLFISNGDTNTAWTIVDGQTNTTGNGIVDTQGDFVANTPGRGVLLKAAGEDWIEIGRFDPGGLAPGGMNPTISYLPYNQDGVSFGDSAVRHVTNSPFNQFASDSGTLVGGVFRAKHYLYQTQTGTVSDDPTGLSFNSYRMIVTNNSSTNRTFTLSSAVYSNLFNDTVECLLEFNGGSSVTLSNTGNVLLSANWTATTQGDRLSLGWNNYNAKWEEQWRYPAASGGSGPSFADLVWTNTGTAIQTTGIGANTNAIFIYPRGEIVVGTNTVPRLGAPSGDTLYSIRNPSNGEGNYNRIIVGVLGASGSGSQLDHYFSTNFFDSTITVDNGVSVVSWGMNGDITVPQLQLVGKVDNVPTLILEPTANASATPYTFDTSLAHTAGNLNEWKNFGVTQLSLSFSNGVATPAITAYGAGSHPWQFGMATNMVNVQLTATNVLEVVVNGVPYLIPASLK